MAIIKSKRLKKRNKVDYAELLESIRSLPNIREFNIYKEWCKARVLKPSNANVLSYYIKNVGGN